jgi:hypothetical protein
LFGSLSLCQTRNKRQLRDWSVAYVRVLSKCYPNVSLLEKWSLVRYLVKVSLSRSMTCAKGRVEAAMKLHERAIETPTTFMLTSNMSAQEILESLRESELFAEALTVCRESGPMSRMLRGTYAMVEKEDEAEDVEGGDAVSVMADDAHA